MKLPNTQDVAEMLAQVNMAVEETADGLRVFWCVPDKEYGRFTGPGHFLDYWGRRAADAIYENRKLEFFRETYVDSDDEGKDELLRLLRDHVLSDDPALSQRMQHIRWVAPADLEGDWVSHYANVLTGPWWAGDFDLGILKSILVFEPSLKPWVEDIRRELRVRIGLPSR
ncbi:hypothetical protein [Stenotrophomonas sp. C1657]|uniref:hypothetical protein n=1 Tax=Stenotrophomonas sp. C1657 TaxID=3077844 RepID=UPI00293C9358|nr:hypothetical protein [Stenotrophomonas sp. C1657]MDV3514683.1 hypothetical protein [Stenotrophomonas sp. C1657]